MDTLPIDIHYQKLEEWLNDRSTYIKKKNPAVFKDVLEGAPKLVQLVRYELPALKKTVGRAEHAEKANQGGIQEAIKAATQYRKIRRETLLQYGLLGSTEATSEEERAAAEKKVLEDLDGALSRQIVTAASNLELNVRNLALPSTTSTPLALEIALAEYETALKTVLTDSGLASSKEHASSVPFPWLKKLAKDSNDLRSSSKDEVIAAVRKAFGLVPATEEQKGGEPDIVLDWGDDLDAAPAPTGGSAEPALCLEVDWGDDNAVASQAPSQLQTTENEDEGLTMKSAAMPKPPSDGRIIVWEERHRGPLTDELRALKAFFVEQLWQAKNASQNPICCAGNITIVEQYVTLLDGLLKVLTDETTLELLRMHNSYRHKERFLQRIEQLGYNATQKDLKRQQLTEQIATSREEADESRPEVDRLVKQIKDLQRYLERRLAEVYAPREVNLVGDLNSI